MTFLSFPFFSKYIFYFGNIFCPEVVLIEIANQVEFAPLLGARSVDTTDGLNFVVF